VNDTKALVTEPFLRPGTSQLSQQVGEHTCTIDSPPVSPVQPLKQSETSRKIPNTLGHINVMPLQLIDGKVERMPPLWHGSS
jgi:hypothetical protein